jgi:aspartate aminotransferase
VVLLHAAAHNPTGVDPTQAQWDELAEIFAKQSLVPLFDTAYQGFATGDCVRDAYPLRAFDSAVRGQARLFLTFCPEPVLTKFSSIVQHKIRQISNDKSCGLFVYCMQGVNSIMCQSFAKNMGLYGERVGAIHIVCETAEESDAVLSRVKQEVIRPNYSSPPRHGAEIAAEVLTDEVRVNTVPQDAFLCPACVR